MNRSRSSRWLVLGGYLIVASGLVIQIWLIRQEPHRFLVGPITLFASFVLIGSAWWVCLPTIQAVSGQKAVGQSLVLFGLAGAVLFAGNVLYIWDWTGGWDFLTQALTAFGYLAAGAGFLTSLRDATSGRIAEPQVSIGV